MLFKPLWQVVFLWPGLLAGSSTLPGADTSPLSLLADSHHLITPNLQLWSDYTIIAYFMKIPLEY